MFLHPPTRLMAKFVEGEIQTPPQDPVVKTSDLPKFLEVYRKVTARCGRECESCGKPYLAAPHLRLAVLDPHDNWFRAKNLRVLCTTCNLEREKTLTPAAAEVTKPTRNAVFKREGSTCLYCHRGPMNGHIRTVVPRVESPDIDDANDWVCSCRNCAKERGSTSHVEYLTFTAARAFDVWACSRELIEAEQD